MQRHTVEHVTSPTDQNTVFAEVQLTSGSRRDGGSVVSRMADITQVLDESQVSYQSLKQRRTSMQESGGGPENTHQNPSENTPMRTIFCSGGRRSVLSIGSGMTKMSTSVTTWMTPCAIQNHNLLWHVQAGSSGSQFRGKQMVAPPMMPATAQTARKARKKSQRRWKVGSGKTRRNWRRKVVLRRMMVPWYPSDEIKINCSTLAFLFGTQ